MPSPTTWWGEASILAYANLLFDSSADADHPLNLQARHQRSLYYWVRPWHVWWGRWRANLVTVLESRGWRATRGVLVIFAVIRGLNPKTGRRWLWIEADCSQSFLGLSSPINPDAARLVQDEEVAMHRSVQLGLLVSLLGLAMAPVLAAGPGFGDLGPPGYGAGNPVYGVGGPGYGRGYGWDGPGFGPGEPGYGWGARGPYSRGPGDGTGTPGTGLGRPDDYWGDGPGYGQRGQRQGFGRGPTGHGGGPRQGPMNPSITR